MIVEPAAPPQPAATFSRRSTLTIAAVVVLAVAAGAVVGMVLLGGRGGSALGASASYVPADSVMYFEARLDLPGTQRQHLRAILDRFPAAGDPDDVLGEAVADMLDDALAQAGAPLDYSGDIAPWFDGRVSMAMLDYPLNANPMDLQLPSMLFAFGVRDAAEAASFGDALRAEMEAAGVTFTSTQHRGTTVWELDVDPSMMGMVSGAGFAHALTDDQLLLSFTAETLTQALDVGAGEGDSLADRNEVRELAGRLPADAVGIATVNTAALLAEMQAELQASDPELAEAMSAFLDSAPPFSVSTVSFADDAVLMDGASGVPDGPLAPANVDRHVAERVPGDAIFFMDAPNVGNGLEQVILGLKAGLAAGPEGMGQEELEQVEAALGAGLEDFVSWIGEGAMAAGWDGSQPYFGLVLQAADPDAAATRLDQLAALAELAGSDTSTGVQVSSEDVGGVEVTTIRTETAGMMGVASELVLEWAIDGDYALIGVGDRFVRQALAQDPANSLAQAERYTTALGRFGGGADAGAFFLDLAALREAVVAALPPDVVVEYRGDIEDNLEPLDLLVGVSRVDGDVWESHYALTLR